MKRKELISVATESPLYWGMNLRARYLYVKELNLLYGEMIQESSKGI